MFGKPKNDLPEGVNHVDFRGEDWYEARNDNSQAVFRTPEEAEKRYRAIDAYSKAYRD